VRLQRHRRVVQLGQNVSQSNVSRGLTRPLREAETIRPASKLRSLIKVEAVGLSVADLRETTREKQWQRP